MTDSVDPLRNSVYPGPEWTSARAFLNGVGRALEGVVRVTIGSAGCTGWLITDTLVIIPEHALGREQEPRLECWLPGEPEPVTAVLEFRSSTDADAHADNIWPALLRLTRPTSGRTLRLGTGAAVPGEPVLLLHYPMLLPDVQISQGRVLSVRGREEFTHDAPSTGGSGGAPVIRADRAEVLGVHYAATTSVSSKSGSGLSSGVAAGLASMLAALRESSAWPEIAAAHRLAGVGRARTSRGSPPPEAPPGALDDESSELASEAASEPADDALLRAALTWTLDPAQWSAADRERIQPWIDDPDEPTWSLAPPERRRLIGSARSLEALRQVHDPAGEPGPGGDTVTRILAGPPYRLDDVPDEQLPYWLQAVAWFDELDELVPELPRPAEVQQALAVRRIRGRLRDSTSTRLWGRDGELATLRAWFAGDDPPPMAVSGIGGVGKSALVARFALDLPAQTLLLWLDFDRADLSPDNAVSVVAALGEQIGVQRQGFAVPPVDASKWRTVAMSLSSALAGSVALLVLDGFEVAQHMQRNEELWDVLELVVGRNVARVLISGRAPVPGLEVAGREVGALPLAGIPDEEARAWLAERGVTDPGVVEGVLQAAHGLPLLLKLALRLLETGDDLPVTLDQLPAELVSGFLYRRILNRVGTPRIRALARDALILRRITRDVVAEVLGDRIPAGLDADQVVALLARDLALVEGAEAPTGADAVGSWLRMRPEVRVATLQLLENEDRERNRVIDRRAARWYGRHTPAPTASLGEQLVAAAERVYHLARVGDVDAAREAWVDGCQDLLLEADQEVPDAFPAARDWLRQNLIGTSYRPGTGPGDTRTVAAWEAEVVRRVRDAFARGLDRTVAAFLEENSARSDDSPLLIYDAWVLRSSGRIGLARALLARAGAAPGAVGWGRTIVAARTAVLDGDPRGADRLLAGIDLTPGSLEPDHASAVTAARIRLALDLLAEGRVLQVGDDPDANLAFRTVLAPWDLVLPVPPGFLGTGSYHRLPPVPESPSGAVYLAEAMDSARRRTLRDGYTDRRTIGPELDAELPVAARDPDSATSAELGSRLADLSIRRWRLAVHSTFFADVRRSIEGSTFVDLLRLSLAGSLAAFWSAELRYEDGMPLTEVARWATGAAGATRADPANSEQFDRMRVALEVVTRLDPKSGLRYSLPGFTGTGPFLWSSLSPQGWEDGSNCALLVALGPDPLEELERRALGLPELKAK